MQKSLGSLSQRVASRFDPVVLPAAAVAIVVALGFGLVVPVLPLYARSFGVAAAQVGLVVSVFALMRLVTDWPAGRLVGRIGPGRATALGTAIVGCSSFAAGLAPTFLWLLILRGVGGIGSALFSTGLSSYLLAAIPRERMGRAMGLYHAAFLLGSTFGPSVGGLAAGWLGLRGPFFVYAGFCAAASVVALAVLRLPRRNVGGAGGAAEPGAGEGSRVPGSTVEQGAPALRPSRTLVAALSGGFALWWLMSGFRFALIPLYGAEHLGLDTLTIGLGITGSAVAMMLVLWPAGWVADRLGRWTIGVPAFGGLALVPWLLLVAEGQVGYVLANAVFGAVHGAASVVPGALLADATPRGRAGEAAGLSHAVSDLGSFTGPMIVGAALDLAGYPGAIVLAVAPAVLAAGAIGSAPRGRPAPAGSAPAGPA
jgi:MFS family permease